MMESIGDALVFLLEIFGWTVDWTRRLEKPPRDEQVSMTGGR